MSNCDSISFLQNIALTSGADRGEAIDVDPDNLFTATPQLIVMTIRTNYSPTIMLLTAGIR